MAWEDIDYPFCSQSLMDIFFQLRQHLDGDGRIVVHSAAFTKTLGVIYGKAKKAR